MLRIRLRRVGKKGKPSYRIVVADSTAPRDGAYLEWIGNYDPMANPPAITLKEDRAAQWLSKGAQPSDAVARILDKSGLFQRTEQFRTATRKSADEAPTGAVAAAAPTEVTLVEVADSPEATVEETPTDEAPEEATAVEASVDEAPVEEESADAPEEEEPAEASVEEAPVEEAAADAPEEEEPAEASVDEDPDDEEVADAPEEEEPDEASVDEESTETPEKKEPDEASEQ